MNFDIEEVIEAMQRTCVRSVRVENGDEVDIDVEDDRIVIRRVDQSAGE